MVSQSPQIRIIAACRFSHLQEHARFLDSKAGINRWGGLVAKSLNGTCSVLLRHFYIKLDDYLQVGRSGSKRTTEWWSSNSMVHGRSTKPGLAIFSLFTLTQTKGFQLRPWMMAPEVRLTSRPTTLPSPLPSPPPLCLCPAVPGSNAAPSGPMATLNDDQTLSQGQFKEVGGTEHGASLT